jgi:hypothetical protein
MELLRSRHSTTTSSRLAPADGLGPARTWIGDPRVERLRVVGKPEEGGPGVCTKRFSADVCLLFAARDSGKRFARRASLLQAKRLYRKRSALDVDYYPVYNCSY